MSDRAVLTTKSKQNNVLQTLLSQGLDPALVKQLQGHIDSSVQAQVQQQIKTKEAQIKAALKVEFEKTINTYAANLEATFDQRVANEVAAKVQQIIEQNRLARHRQFGPSSESGQQSLFNEAEFLADHIKDDQPEEHVARNVQRKSKPKARGHRRALPPELPRVEVIVDVPKPQRLDGNGQPMVRIGQEVSEQLDIIPMKIRVIRTVRPKYAPAKGNGAPVIAPMPASILPRTNFSAGALAMLLTVKYADGLPLYRFGKVLSRHGIQVPRQSLARYAIEASKALQPVANLMRDALLDASIMHLDETTVQVLKEPGKKPTSKSYMWVQYGGPPDKPVVLFDYEPTRSGSVAVRLLEGWSGHLMTDDYAGYNAVASKQGITHLACMAHARRKFIEAKRSTPNAKSGHADTAITMFAQLYRIEKRIKNAPDALRYRVRQKLSKETLHNLHAWLMEMLPKVTPKSKLGEALSYLNKNWNKLMRYIERGDLPIDNNVCENAIRPFVIGRKNWLFSNTQAGAHASALIYSLVETAKANGREPYAWLCYVLERLPLAKNVDEIEALLPWNTTDQDLAMNLISREEWG